MRRRQGEWEGEREGESEGVGERGGDGEGGREVEGVMGSLICILLWLPP